jgi:hypothetical protein
MSLEENKAIIRKMVRAFNKKDLAVIDEFIAPDYVDHTNQLRGGKMSDDSILWFSKTFPISIGLLRTSIDRQPFARRKLQGLLQNPLINHERVAHHRPVIRPRQSPHEIGM